MLTCPARSVTSVTDYEDAVTEYLKVMYTCKRVHRGCVTQTMPRGSPTSDDIRQEIVRLYLDTANRSPSKISAALSSDPKFTDRVPSERTISNFISTIKQRYDAEQRRLDQP